MDSVLIVSSQEKSTDFFVEILKQFNKPDFEATTASTCSQARRMLLDRTFDLIIINCPLSDEFGHKLALSISTTHLSQIILVVKHELFDETASRVEDAGIFTVSKPISREHFWGALKLVSASFNKARILKSENSMLLKKIEDIKLIDRAKCLLMEYLNLSEAEAHRYIEKQAMDTRSRRADIAKNILKTYET